MKNKCNCICHMLPKKNDWYTIGIDILERISAIKYIPKCFCCCKCPLCGEEINYENNSSICTAKNIPTKYKFNYNLLEKIHNEILHNNVMNKSGSRLYYIPCNIIATKLE